MSQLSLVLLSNHHVAHAQAPIQNSLCFDPFNLQRSKLISHDSQPKSMQGSKSKSFVRIWQYREQEISSAIVHSVSWRLEKKEEEAVIGEVENGMR